MNGFLPRLLLAFALAAFLSAPARAQTTPAMQAFLDGLSAQERSEFTNLVHLFQGHVRLRLSQGWHHGDNGNAIVAITNFSKAALPGGMTPDEDQGFNVPRLACEDRIESLRAERDRTRYERDHADAGAARKAAAKAAQAAEKLRKCEIEIQRTMGTCQDWAIDVCYLLGSRGRMSAFEAGQTTWDNGSFQHAACRVRLKRDARQSAVFDAWLHGFAEVFPASEWPQVGRLTEFEAVATEP